MNGEQYLANDGVRQVHDLNCESPDCRIDEIIQVGYDRPFNSLAEARAEGYRNCHYCIGSRSVRQRA